MPDVSQIGEKALRLLRLNQLGILTPDFGILSFEFQAQQNQDPTTLDQLIPQILNSVKNWGSEKIIIRASLEFGDEQVAALAGNLISQNDVSPSDLAMAIKDFLLRLKDPQLLEFFKLHSGQSSAQRSAIIIQQMTVAQSHGIFFNQSPTLSSGLHYIEQNKTDYPTPQSFWCDHSGRLWKSSVENKISTLNSRLFKILIEASSKITQAESNNFNFEWIEDHHGQIYVVSLQIGSEDSETVDEYSRTPFKKLLAGPCNALSVEVYQKLINEGINSLLPSINSDNKESESNWIEFFAKRPYANLGKFRRLQFQLSPERGGRGFFTKTKVDGENIDLSKLSLLGILGQIIDLHYRSKSNQNQFKQFKLRAKKLIDEHLSILEHVPSSRESSRLVHNLIAEASGLGPVFENELLLSRFKELLYQISGLKYPELPFQALPGFHEAVTNSTEIYPSIQKLADDIGEDPLFVSTVAAFLESSSKTGQSGDVYYWLRESGFHKESYQIHDFLKIYGKTSFFDRRIESPSLSLSPTTFFNIVLELIQNGKQPAARKEGPSSQLPKLNWIRRFFLNVAAKLYFQGLKQRAVSSDLLDDFLYVIRSGIRSMATHLQQENPKLFPDQDAPPDLSVLGIDMLRDYGSGLFGPDVLIQLMKRNIRESSTTAFYCPDVFFHKKSDRDPYFIHPDLKAELSETQLLLDSNTIKGSLNLSGKIQFIEDPASLISGSNRDTRFLISEAPIEGIALFIRPHQIGIFSQINDADWTISKLRSLGVHSLVMNQIPEALRTDGQLVEIRIEPSGRVNIE